MLLHMHDRMGIAADFRSIHTDTRLSWEASNFVKIIQNTSAYVFKNGWEFSFEYDASYE